MEWIKEELKLFKIHQEKDQKEFEAYNALLILGRIKIVSLYVIVLSLFWAYMDWKIIQNGADKIYSTTLVVMHVVCVVISILFLIFYEHMVKRKKAKNNQILFLCLHLYVFLYILFGALSSINSQRYTGNIYSYLILSLIAAVAFPLRPIFMLMAFAVNHIIFVLGILALCTDMNVFLAKMINATVLSGAVVLLGFTFYRHRLKEYFYRKSLKENEENFKKLFYVNPYPLFITKLEEDKIVAANHRACSLMGVHNKNLDAFNEVACCIKRDSELVLQQELEEHSKTFHRIVEYELNGKRMWVTANYELIDYLGEKCILTGIMDITEIRKAEEELTHFASIDPLTGILNRRMGIKKLEELLDKSKKEYLEFVLCFIDINDLKYVNDTLGHKEGDYYILTLCNMIQKQLCEHDVFFRMGGDEFIIIFKNKSLSKVEKVWTNIKMTMKEINHQNLLPYKIMASHGLFYYNSSLDIDIDQIIERADQKMYEEKQNLKTK